MSDCNLSAVNCLPLCHGPRNSFVSYDNQSVSMIDYVLFPVECIDFVMHCEIADDNCLNVSRHRPILCCIKCTVSNSKPHIPEHNINWKKANDAYVTTYRNCITNDPYLNNLSQCELDAERIDQAYTTVCEQLVIYADSVFPRKRYRAHLKPYWTSELSELHNGMMRARRDWCEAGRPRGNESGSFLHYKNLNCV